MGLLAHIGDISYNVFNRRISLLLNLQTPYFAMYYRKQYFTMETL